MRDAHWETVREIIIVTRRIDNEAAVRESRVCRRSFMRVWLHWRCNGNLPLGDHRWWQLTVPREHNTVKYFWPEAWAVTPSATNARIANLGDKSDRVDKNLDARSARISNRGLFEIWYIVSRRSSVISYMTASQRFRNSGVLDPPPTMSCAFKVLKPVREKSTSLEDSATAALYESRKSS